VVDPSLPPSTVAVGMADVAVSGSTIILGPFVSGWGIPVGNGTFIFERSADGSWRHEGALPDFGWSGYYSGPVAMCGDRAIMIWNDQWYMPWPVAVVFERDASNAWQQTSGLSVPANVSYPLFNSLTADVALDGDRAILASSRSETWIYELQPDGTWLKVAEFDGGNSVGIEGDFAVVAGPAWLNWPDSSVSLMARDETGAWGVAQVLLDSVHAAVAMGGGRILVVDPESATGYVYIPEPASAVLLVSGIVVCLRRRSNCGADGAPARRRVRRRMHET